MTRRIDKDHFDKLHDYGLYIPTRTIDLSSNHDDDGDENGVNHYMATKFIKNLHILESLNHEPIRVLLNTEGGDIYQGMAIFDAIRDADSFITIEAIGSVESMGSIILQAGDERLVHKHTKIMFHLGEMEPSPGNPEEVKRGVDFELKYGYRIDDILYKRMLEKNPNLTRGKFNEMNWKSKHMFGDETVELGLADRVIDKDAERAEGRKAR